MINKRLLIRNLLAHNDENSFYDKKRFIAIGTKEGKAKFVKHICAMANSNPNNNAYIVVGVEDEDNKIVGVDEFDDRGNGIVVEEAGTFPPPPGKMETGDHGIIKGVDFFDDSKIQNLVNAYLDPAPEVSYENIQWPSLPEGKVVGLVTIRSTGKVCALRKNIWKYYGGMVFFREGSISYPKAFDIKLEDRNSERVYRIEMNSINNMEQTLDGVVDFLVHRHANLVTNYKVFKEQYVLCWAGNRIIANGKEYFTRADIELVNEQRKLFYSDLDQIEITYDDDRFTIVEYVRIGLVGNQRFYPLEKVDIEFRDNGSYRIHTQLLFEKPQFNRRQLHHLYNTNDELLKKLRRGQILSPMEFEDLQQLPHTYLICYLNGFEEARDKMEASRELLKRTDQSTYRSLKESLRIIRKVRYS